MTGQFEGQVALVTGGGSGIGRACALAFARTGAKVVVSDITVSAGEATVNSIQQAGGEALFVPCNVSQPAEVETLLARVVENFGRLDYACNNAGIEGAQAPTANYPESAWDQVIAINLTGVWLCMKHELTQMLRQDSGAIVNIASILGLVGFGQAPADVAAEHGVLGLTKTAAIEYAARGIRINAVCPGFVATPMLERSGIVEGTETYAALAGLHPQRRLGTPDEVANTVMWLCSKEATFVTGHALVVDGGYVAQ